MGTNTSDIGKQLGLTNNSSSRMELRYEWYERREFFPHRAYLQAAKRRTGPVWEFYQASLRRTGSTTHARLNTQRKILLTLWTLWLTGREFDPNEFFRSQPIDV